MKTICELFNDWETGKAPESENEKLWREAMENADLEMQQWIN